MNQENAFPRGCQQVQVPEKMRQRARKGEHRHGRLVCEEPGDQVAVGSFITWLNTAFRALAAARARAVTSKSTDSGELGRERDERCVINARFRLGTLTRVCGSSD